MLQRLFKGITTAAAGTDGREPDLSTPVDECRYVVFDTELTGLDIARDSIVSVGAMIMTGGRISSTSTMNPRSCIVSTMTSRVRRRSVLSNTLD